MILCGDWSPGACSVRINFDSKLKLGQGLYIANLEGPILTKDHDLVARPKAGPVLFSSQLPENPEKFVFSLANNHLMDYNFPGLASTLCLMHEQGCRSCGAGIDENSARNPIVVDDNGIQVGIVSCCEAQFGVSRNNSAGVAEFGPWVYRSISDLLQIVEIVIVSIHAGVEDSPWPSPYIQNLYRSFIDAGATVVHGHHAHVPQGYEEYGKGVIFYGMGNFAVDPDKWCSEPNTLWSLAAELDFGSHPLRWKPLTLEIRHEPGSGLILIEESNSDELVSRKHYLDRCNRPFDEPNLFAGLWQEVAIRAYHHYGAKYMKLDHVLTVRSKKDEINKLR